MTKRKDDTAISVIIGGTRQGRGGNVDKGLTELDKQANVMIDDLTWRTAALKAARER